MPEDEAARVICEWMEPKPSEGPFGDSYPLDSRHGWWTPKWKGTSRTGGWHWIPRNLDLDALREVEERLTDEQWKRYVSWFTFPPPPWQAKAWLHASAEQKILALAAVLKEAKQRD